MFAVSFQRSCRPLSKFVRIHPTRTGTGTRILNNTRRKNSSLTTESKEKVTQRPIRIILVRHGESLGNVDESAYVSTPDWCVPLTEKGRQQAYDAGKELSEIVGKDGKVFFYFSPYKRTRETVEQFQKHINAEQIISVREEPRISEQQFGNFQNVEEVLESKKERHVFGRFYYRFKSGEAGLDVYSRVSSFISTLVRDCQQYQKAGYDLDTINVVIVTHGLSLRLFLMRWFQFSVEEFEESENPDNAKLVVMQKRCHGGHRWYELQESHREVLNLPKWCTKPKNVILHNLESLLDDEECEDDETKEPL